MIQKQRDTGWRKGWTVAGVVVILAVVGLTVIHLRRPSSPVLSTVKAPHRQVARSSSHKSDSADRRVSSIPSSRHLKPDTGSPVISTPADSKKPRDVGELPYRICAMTRAKNSDVVIGLVNTANESFVLKPGQSTPDGFRLVSADFFTEIAKFDRNGQVYLAKLDPGARVETPVPAPPRAPVPPADATDVVAPTEESADSFAKPQPTLEFTDVVVQTESAGSFAVTTIPNSPTVVQMNKEGQSYALPKQVAQAILNSPRLSADQKHDALMSFPALTEIRQGEDPAARLKEAQIQLSTALVPPTNMPPPPPTDLPSAPPTSAPAPRGE